MRVNHLVRQNDVVENSHEVTFEFHFFLAEWFLEPDYFIVVCLRNITTSVNLVFRLEGEASLLQFLINAGKEGKRILVIFEAKAPNLD